MLGHTKNICSVYVAKTAGFPGTQGKRAPVGTCVSPKSKTHIQVCTITRVSQSRSPSWGQSAGAGADSRVGSDLLLIINDRGSDTYPKGCEPTRESEDVKPRDRSDCADPPIAGEKSLDRSRRADSSARGLLAQPKMRSVAMIVRDVLGQKPPEMTLVQGDDVVKQFTSAAANPAFRNTVLPGALDGGLEASNAHGSNCRGNLQTVFRIVIEDEKLGCRSVRKRFPQCCTTQALVGWYVTLKCRTRLRS